MVESGAFEAHLLVKLYSGMSNRVVDLPWFLFWLGELSERSFVMRLVQQMLPLKQLEIYSDKPQSNKHQVSSPLIVLLVYVKFPSKYRTTIFISQDCC